jgi:hypothetical protein
MNVLADQAITRALRVIATHPAVVDVRPGPDMRSGTVTVMVDIDTNLPGPWRAGGRSENGVLAVEPVVFAFSAGFPLSAPKVFLREGFDTAHPHLMPVKPGCLPRPCFLAGSTREMMRSRGIPGVVDQVADWLQRAALVRLIDPTHGWEPTRRDSFDDITICDPDWMRGTAGRDTKATIYEVAFRVHELDAGATIYTVMVDSEPLPLTADIADKFTFRSAGRHRWGNGLALAASSGKTAAGAPFVADRYLPESVTDVASLHRRAQDLGCGDVFAARMALLQTRLAGVRFRTAVPLAVFLLARRPCNVIGSDSPIEICPYLVELSGNDDLSSTSAKPVRIAMNRDTVSVQLLRRASGDGDGARRPWTLLGCGSVGSKLAVHLARSGRGPSEVVDHGLMQPHNWARHALLPGSEKERIFAAKADMLAEEMSALRQPATALSKDILFELETNPGQVASLFASDRAAVVNATGSVAVREGLLALLPPGPRARIVESCLLGGGALAYMAVEGPDANPSAADLAVEGYRQIHGNQTLREDVFSARAQALAIGQGCSSLTFPLSDARLSALTAPMAEVLADYLRTGLPAEGGELLLGQLAPDGVGQTWDRIGVDPWVTLPRDGTGDLSVRLSRRVDRAIREAVAAKPGRETGGVLVGRFVDLTNTFHVVDLIPAPPDSRFSPHEFVLGTEGLTEALDDLVIGTGGALHALGTWHNHLLPSGASAKDLRTALRLAEEQMFPVLMLIWTPDGYRTLIVETQGGGTGPSASSHQPEKAAR